VICPTGTSLTGPTASGLPPTAAEQLADDPAMLKRTVMELIRRGVYCTPGGKLYLSLAHCDADIGRTLEIAATALRALR
jgi:glutamate-1-semialdehyde aminotransferase